MKALLSILCLLAVVSVQSATYYVRTDGHDAASGLNNTSDASGGAWLTQQKALNIMAAGDTTLVQPGIYSLSSGYRVWTTHDGTTNSRITLRAVGAVTNYAQEFWMTNSYFTLDGFIFSQASINGSPNQYIIQFGPGTTNCFVLNNTLQYSTNLNGIGWPQQSPGTDGVIRPTNTTSAYCVVSNNVLNGIADDSLFDIRGSYQLVTRNMGINDDYCDTFRIFGCSNVVSYNLITNMLYTQGLGFGNHPDCFQTYGDFSEESYGHVLDGNKWLNCQCFLCQLTDDHTNTPSIHIGDWTVRNCVFNVLLGAGSIDIPGMRFINDIFYRCNTNNDGLLSFSANVGPGGGIGSGTNGTVLNCAFIGCGLHSGFGWYGLSWSGSECGISNAFGMTLDYNCLLHWNGTNWTAKNAIVAEWPETHGINNGQFPGYLDAAEFDFHLTNGCYLIDAGTNTGLVVDMDGATRPLGASMDIGPYEFDPNLKLRFDFNHGPIAAHRVLDATGFGHDAVQMDPTNFLTTTIGPDGTTSSYGVPVGYAPLGYSNVWYGAITNISGIDFITNGTFSAWVLKLDGNVLDPAHGNRWDTILDCGYPPASSSNPSAATNSWTVSYGFSDLREDTTTNFVFRVYGNSITNDLAHPSLQVGWPGPTATTNWHHLAATWEGGGNLVLYYDGQPWSTNALGSPWLRISAAPTTPWMGLNAQTHEGTPQWGDDNYPNYGMLKGELDEVRIYNRALSAAEVKNLYDGNGAAPVTAQDGEVTIQSGPSTGSGAVSRRAAMLIRLQF